MASQTLSLTFKLKDLSGGLVKLSGDADSLRKMLGATAVEGEKLKASIINLASIGTVFTQLGDADNQLSSSPLSSIPVKPLRPSSL